MSKETENQKKAIRRAAFFDINKFGQSGEFEKAVKAANRILGIAPDDQTALHCKVICLIQMSKLEEAHKFIEKNKLSWLIFERAYCEYRLNQPDKALKTIDSCETSPLPRNLKELRAQVLYRLEQFKECYQSYKEIIKNTTDDYEHERKTNLSAVAANLAVDETREISNLPEETYEMCFNSACALANRGKYFEAEKKLKIAEKLCRESLEEEGISDEELMEEIDIIRVQIAYCLQMQGKQKESGIIYSDCLKNKPKDPAVCAVASNNLVVINKDQNVFDSKKKIRVAMADSCEHKLTSRQKKVIALNNCLLALFTNSNDCQNLCNKLIQSYPDLEFKAILIKCSQLVKDKKNKDAIDLLNKHADCNDKKSFANKFAIIQLLLFQGNRKEAIEVLHSLGESKYKPGIVSALVTLYLGTDNKQAASNLLKSAVDWYKKNNFSSGDLSDMWRQAADFHLRGGATETAASSLEELLKIKPNDMKVLAQLVIAYAQINPKKALEVSKKLPALETLTTTSEIDALEAANWVMSTKAAKKSVITKIEQSPCTPGDLQSKKKTNRKRKGKLPKNFNSEVGPDPERWLPKYERAGFRKKRDRRAKDIIKGSQGMSTGSADQYDMSKNHNLNKNSPLTPVHQETAPGLRQQHRRSGGHNKKKKGRH